MYEKLKERYKRKGCTKEQLDRFAALGQITMAERDSILEEAQNGEFTEDAAGA